MGLIHCCKNAPTLLVPAVMLRGWGGTKSNCKQCIASGLGISSWEIWKKDLSKRSLFRWETCEGSRKHIKWDNPKIPRKIRRGFAGLLIYYGNERSGRLYWMEGAQSKISKKICLRRT